MHIAEDAIKEVPIKNKRELLNGLKLPNKAIRNFGKTSDYSNLKILRADITKNSVKNKFGGPNLKMPNMTLQEKLLHNKSSFNKTQMSRNLGMMMKKSNNLSSTLEEKRKYPFIASDINNQRKRRQIGGSISNKFTRSKRIAMLNKSNELVQPPQLITNIK